MHRLVALVAELAIAHSTELHAQRRRAVGRGTWPAQLTAAPIMATTVAGRTINSSSKLRLTWRAPSSAIDHYAITATETAGGVPLSYSATGTSSTLGALESGTEYRIAIAACLDAKCSRILTVDATDVRS